VPRLRNVPEVAFRGAPGGCKRLAVGVLVGSILFAGCGRTIQVYPGPELPRESTSVIISPVQIHVELDGKDIARGVVAVGKANYNILPGHYRVRLSSICTLPSPMTVPARRLELGCEIAFDAEAGSSYVASVENPPPGDDNGEIRLFESSDTACNTCESRTRFVLTAADGTKYSCMDCENPETTVSPWERYWKQQR
jgi:hypothetical protein